MKTFDRAASSTVFSTRVLSHDECSILVETGNTEPTISFLARAVAGGLDDDEDNIDGKPPAKRRKITVHDKGNVKQHEIQPAPKKILLGRITLDLNFATSLDNIDGRKHGRDNDSHIAVSLTSVQQVDDVLSLKVRLPSKLGAVLCIDAAAVAPDVYEGLQRCVSNAKSKDRPASVYTCHLRRSKGNTLSLKASLSWLSGVSAFPAGAPVGKTRVYEDYDLYSHFFPDLERSLIDHGGSWTPQDFYESVYTTDKTVKVELDDLTDTPLFPFQQRTVHWMLAREQVDRPSRSCPYLHDTSFLQQGQDALGEAIFHDPLQAMLLSERSSNESFSGGILAEEMGLGKSLEITALIAGHPCPGRQSVVLDKPSQTEVVPSKATLIIGPAVIIHQWRSELSQHAPKLKVFVYTGINNDIDQIDKLANDYDVVLTSYQTLAHEVHFATDPPERNMRHQRKYERKKSPLIQILWWRICLDEAQMVESGVTAAARVACRLPRVHSWAVSGTPVKRNVEDLYGLLVFLRLEPFASNAKLWSHLITNHRHLFKRLFGTIALRHTKAQVRDEITLPPQKRVVMSLPFTAVESQHYLTLFSEMCKDVGVGSDGSPASGEWNPNDPRVVETMRNWLVRLRQTCLHPQVGHKNRRRLGRSQGPLRTVAEVLDVMIEQNESATRLEERGMIQAQIARAHIIGNARDDQTRSKRSLLIYRSAQVKCEAFVKEARERLAAAVTNGEGATEAQSDDEDSSSEAAPLVGRLRNALRAALQLLHVSVYFAATATYQIKVNEEITIPDSDEFKELEQQEVALYERAKLIRKEILKDASTKAERAMSKIKDLRTSGTLLQLPALKDLDKVGGIESRRIVTTSYDLFDLIRDMQPHIYEWREMIMNILTKPLVDEDDSTNEITGDEYEESTKQQDELYVYFDALKTLQADLNRCVTGETAPLIDHEAKSLMRGAKRWLDPEVPTELKEQPHAPELLLKLFGIRQAFRTKLDSVNSVRGLIAEARHLQDGPQLGGRALAESEIAKRLLRELQVILSSYTKALAQLQKEIELCGETQNLRLEFYRQLQELSDAVAPYKEDLDETLDTTAMERALDNEELFSSSLAELRTKHRFLMHLKEESTQQESARICVICQSSFDNGVLTVCGHQYCKECIQHWWAAHRTCPVCKRRLALVDFHNITYKPQEVKVQEEHHMLPEVATDSSLPAELTSIYSEVDPQLREQIKSADLSSSYGTKIDTLSRHLLWIREHDPGAKSIVFSQYREFLDVLSTAFSEFKIGYARLGRTNAVENFRQNPSIDCLLLDAKTDSSGLTLVNATHVFICEPLVQTAVELQAIARVHRIGQTRPTTVWMYLVNDTVEESIYEISVKRRLAHVQARQVSKATQSGASTPALGEQAIDAANSEELQNAPLSKLLATGKGGGELVEKSDLWQCLFGHAKSAAPLLDDGGARDEFERNVRAQAAELRARR